MTKDEARLIVRTMLEEYEGDDYSQLVEDMKQAIKMYENENKYNNLIDADGFEINPGIVQDCVIWLVGGAVESPVPEDGAPKREHITFFSRVTLFGNEKPTIFSFDIPEKYHDDIEGMFRWGVDQLIGNFRMKLDMKVNTLINENGNSDTVEKL